MGFKYIDALAVPENVDKLLTLVDAVTEAVSETDSEKEGVENYLKYNFDLVPQGIQIARQAKLLFAVKWEEALDRSMNGAANLGLFR